MAHYKLPRFVPVSIKKATLFRGKYWHEHVPSNIELRYLNGPSYHAYIPRVRHAFETRDRDTLWLSFTPGDLIKHTHAVWTRCLRRGKHVFQEALEQRGLDRDGRRLVLDDKGKVIEKQPGITGSLQITLGAGFPRATREEMLEQAGLILRHVQYIHYQHRQSGDIKPDETKKPQKERKSESQPTP
ncbi:hypothetical protein AJ80_01914 [Polytolypa hystricis UAMH7299]|uniref:Uncharacterized protein n=1 Tax=Polytolypa hystricis (strain UAMH7299) TaxID=1447883 RepID=A0A2B7YXN3_POLH7|nr:hypothetical protein AJ80_01914 [Polytolypa hystricis UAMH7299]